MDAGDFARTPIVQFTNKPLGCPLLADSVEKVGLWESCFLAVQKTLQFWRCCVKTKTAPSSAF
ncbi:hypothetical protein [Pseudomonas aeruginosa]|uniref:hypothetical protein n=1 Tax=Pseudomonas aeruginosa TaxID=287 RepID=UPI00301C1382